MAETRVFNQAMAIRERLTLYGGRVERGQTIYTASGAIAIEPGLHKLQGAGPFVMTLAQPTAAQEGWVMTIYSDTPSAHTVTATGGFGGGGAASDVATFANLVAAKNALVVMAVNLHWVILSNVGILVG